MARNTVTTSSARILTAFDQPPLLSHSFLFPRSRLASPSTDRHVAIINSTCDSIREHARIFPILPEVSGRGDCESRISRTPRRDRCKTNFEHEGWGRGWIASRMLKGISNLWTHALEIALKTSENSLEAIQWKLRLSHSEFRLCTSKCFNCFELFQSR